MVSKSLLSRQPPPSSPKFDLASFPVTETISMLTCLLKKITAANDSIQQKQSNYTCFHARSLPSIDIDAYLLRILKYCPCANECFLSLLVYFDRMSQNKLDPLRIDSYNIHRLVIAGIMVSSKFFSDIFYTNTRYAKVGGLPVKELNVLELEFLRINNYNIFIPLEELQQYGDQLLMHAIREKEAQLKHEQRLMLEKYHQQQQSCITDYPFMYHIG
ncbi:cyclin [Mucor lusitanicus]|uniref:Cyclin n=2 Tax=Mucor circinelloides f. lusitanicus TaxID=29924 RepID=A0A168HS91_MUCCL|nr:cyclin [Mucor lusitanicus]OAC99121.1 cyclin [Mucor lusitanicus CBS 277.49]